MNFSVEALEFNRDMRDAAVPVLVFIGLLSLIGILGNCIVIFVYTRNYPTCNFKYFVLVLAGIDLGSCFVLMPMEIYTLLNYFVYKHSWLCKAKSFFNAFTVTASATTLLLIAIDRFRKVCRPHKKQIQPSLAIKLSVLVLSISAIPAASDAVFWGIHTHEVPHQGNNLTLKMCEKDDRFKNTILPRLHVIILYGGTNLIAMITTLVLYSMIAVKMFCFLTISGHDSGHNTTPRIKVTNPGSEISAGASTPAVTDTKPTIFVFPSDAGIESGISDSEDLDASVNLSDLQSTGDLTIDVTNDVSDNEAPPRSPKLPVVAELSNEGSTIEQLEMVPLRNKTANSSTPRVLSIDLDNESSNRNSLQLPPVVQRKAPRSPKFSFSISNEPKEKASSPSSRSFGRRRSTVASITGHSSIRLRRKTLIMFILTAVFVGTIILYFCLIGAMAGKGHFVTSLTPGERSVWIFFLRFYFINSVINPVLYGFLDPRFRKALWNMGIRVGFLAGSVKRNLHQSLRRATSGSGAHNVSVAVHTTYPRPILKSRSSRSTITE